MRAISGFACALSLITSPAAAAPFTTQLYATCEQMFEENIAYLTDANLPGTISTDEEMNAVLEVYAKAPMNIAIRAYLSNFDDGAVAQVFEIFAQDFVSYCTGHPETVIKKALDATALHVGLAQDQADLPPLRE